MTSVIPDNALALVMIGIAFWKSDYKFFILLLIMSITTHMALDWLLMWELKITDNSPLDNNTHIMYYWITSIFFIVWFGIFMMNPNKYNVWIAGLMGIQALLCLMMAVNGAIFSEVSLPEVEFVYVAHSAFNDIIWIVEIVMAWIATVKHERITYG